MKNWLIRLTFAIALGGGCAVHTVDASLVVSQFTSLTTQAALTCENSETHHHTVPWTIEDTDATSEATMESPSISSSTPNVLSLAHTLLHFTVGDDDLVVRFDIDDKMGPPDPARWAIPKPPRRQGGNLGNSVCST